ncbi:FG-GAP-like repeat-containing protein [Catellatospora methionotrophica]|uniref:FG-GAP-like repeat-containing protein n=1 Tax=Catellatospora methionotrophica TaxID=121620 RepID=UPI0033DE6206
MGTQLRRGLVAFALALTGAVVAPAADAAAAEPGMNVTWSTDFSNGWAGWLSTPWNDQPQGAVARPAVRPSPDGQGMAARFYLAGGQQRNESQPTAAQNITEGQTLIVRFTDYLPAGFPTATSDWQVVLQFKNASTGSPPVEIKIGHGKYYLDGNNGAWHYDIGDAVGGRSTTITVRIKFSVNAATAVVDAWHNGNQTVFGQHPKGAGTLYAGQSSYLKTGLYRSTAIGQAGERFMKSMIIGTPGSTPPPPVPGTEYHAGSSTDVNGDGRADVLTFTRGTTNDVYAATSTGSAFAGTTVKWNDYFGLDGEQQSTGDVNGDGRDDIVTFTKGGTDDVYVGLSTGTGFAAGVKWHDAFSPGAQVPALGDVNGDGRDDLVSFTHDVDADVYVALSTGTGFGPAAKWNEFFAVAGEYPGVADVNGDGRDDIVVFTQGANADVYVGLSTGTGFAAGALWHGLFAVGAEQPRLGDVNGDGKADIVTFTCDVNADVYAALSNGSAFVGTTVKWNDFFCTAGEFPYLGDVDGDGRDDAIVFTKGTTNDVYVGLSTGTGFAAGVTWHDFFGLNGETTL